MGLEPGCLFCRIVAGEDAATTVRADGTFTSFLDVRPVFKGHVLVVPRAHHVTLADLPAPLLTPFFMQVQRTSALLPEALGDQGSFVAMNNVVSQSVAHLHCHVVPRTKGDGLRGFFWPRHPYAEGEAQQYADRVREALA